MDDDRIKIEKLFCPFCGEEMIADIHSFSDHSFEYDHWLCNSDGRLDCKVVKQTVYIDRDTIKYMDLDGVY